MWFLFAEQIKKYLCLSACLSVSLSQILSPETKSYSPNLCLGISIVGNVVVWFVWQFLMSWSGIPHSLHLLWWKTTGPAPHIKCQPLCLSMRFTLRNFYDQSRHFFFRYGKLTIRSIYNHKTVHPPILLVIWNFHRALFLGPAGSCAY